MNIRAIRNFLLAASLILVSGFAGYKLGTNDVRVSREASGKVNVEVTNKAVPRNISADFSLFWSVWDEVAEKYVDKSKIDAQKMVFGAISGMVGAIGDPYTVFLPPTENKQAKEQLNGNFEGIGAELGMKERSVVVIAPLPDSPAQKAGVLPGDWIIKVDGASTEKWTLPETVAKIRGPKGTTVTLNILHQSAANTPGTLAAKAIDVKIVRDNIVLKSVSWKIVTSTASANLKPAAYIDLARFGDNTNPQWDKVISEVAAYQATASGKLSGVILDVRNDPGGYLAGAVYIASEFMPSGVVVEQVSYDGTTQTYSVNRAGKLLSVPMVVLINQGTASASEILAGALQAVGRVKLVGAQSFGKGSVQQAEDLPGGAGLHVTTAKWLLSNDVWVQGKGLAPDVKVDNDEKDPVTDFQLDRAVQVLNGR